MSLKKFTQKEINQIIKSFRELIENEYPSNTHEINIELTSNQSLHNILNTNKIQLVYNKSIIEEASYEDFSVSIKNKKAGYSGCDLTQIKKYLNLSTQIIYFISEICEIKEIKQNIQKNDILYFKIYKAMFNYNNTVKMCDLFNDFLFYFSRCSDGILNNIIFLRNKIYETIIDNIQDDCNIEQQKTIICDKIDNVFLKFIIINYFFKHDIECVQNIDNYLDEQINIFLNSQDTNKDNIYNILEILRNDGCDGSILHEDVIDNSDEIATKNYIKNKIDFIKQLLSTEPKTQEAYNNCFKDFCLNVQKHNGISNNSKDYIGYEYYIQRVEQKRKIEREKQKISTIGCIVAISCIVCCLLFFLPKLKSTKNNLKNIK